MVEAPPPPPWGSIPQSLVYVVDQLRICIRPERYMQVQLVVTFALGLQRSASLVPMAIQHLAHIDKVILVNEFVISLAVAH